MRTFECLAAFAVLCVLSSPASPASARAYRWVQAYGAVSFQQFPCGDRSQPVGIRTRCGGWTASQTGKNPFY